MSKYFFWVDGNPLNCTWRNHPQGQSWYKVYLGDKYYGQIFQSRSGDWAAIVDPSPHRRCPSLGGFKTRWLATQFMLWAAGHLAKEDKPFA